MNALERRKQEREYQEYLAKRRRESGVTEVFLCETPPWMRKKLFQAVREQSLRCRRYGLSNFDLLMTIASACGNGGGLDHWGRDSRNFFINEPYDRREEFHEAFAQLLGLEWRYEEHSWWNPGNTIRAVFYPKDSGPSAKNQREGDGNDDA